jgi:hypothetical protein
MFTFSCERAKPRIFWCVTILKREVLHCHRHWKMMYCNYDANFNITVVKHVYKNHIILLLLLIIIIIISIIIITWNFYLISVGVQWCRKYKEQLKYLISMCKTYQVPQQGCYKDIEDWVLEIVLEKKTGSLCQGRSKFVEVFDVTSPFKMQWQVCTASAGWRIDLCSKTAHRSWNSNLS